MLSIRGAVGVAVADELEKQTRLGGCRHHEPKLGSLFLDGGCDPLSVADEPFSTNAGDSQTQSILHGVNHEDRRARLHLNDLRGTPPSQVPAYHRALHAQAPKQAGAAVLTDTIRLASVFRTSPSTPEHSPELSLVCGCSWRTSSCRVPSAAEARQTTTLYALAHSSDRYKRHTSDGGSCRLRTLRTSQGSVLGSPISYCRSGLAIMEVPIVTTFGMNAWPFHCGRITIHVCLIRSIQ